MAGGFGGFDTWGGSPAMPGSTTNLDPSSTRWPAGTAGVALGTGTGQHGTVPVASNLGGGVSDAIDEFWNWLSEPFTGQLSPSGLFVLVGVVLISIIAWNFILFHVRIAAESI